MSAEVGTLHSRMNGSERTLSNTVLDAGVGHVDHEEIGWVAWSLVGKIVPNVDFVAAIHQLDSVLYVDWIAVFSQFCEVSWVYGVEISADVALDSLSLLDKDPKRVAESLAPIAAHRVNIGHAGHRVLGLA